MIPLAATTSPSDRPTADPFNGTEYRAVSLLGAGATGEVFVVEHRGLCKTFAAKLLRPDSATDKRAVDRMRLEAELLANLEHENIVQIHALDVSSAGRPFVVMDLLQGETLNDALVRLGTFEPTQAMVFALHLLNALDAVHGVGIVCRDLKPKDLFIHRTGDGRSVLKLLDLGAAWVLPGVSTEEHGPFDHRSDIRSAASIISWMLVGQGPFVAGHSSKEPPVAWTRAGTRVLPALDRIVRRGLAENPSDRFQTAADFGDAIFEVLMEYEELRSTGRLSPADSNSQQPKKSIANTPSNRRDGAEFASGQHESASPSLELRIRHAAIFVVLFAVTLSLGRFGIKWILR